MRLFVLPTWQTILLDIVIWLLIHLSAVRIALRRSDDVFRLDKSLYRVRSWEASVYETLFQIKRWKHYLPDAGTTQRLGFSKAQLQSKDPQYLERFVVETRRAEYSHYLQMIPAPLFFLFNEPWVGGLMIVYAVVVNLPCIITQRYNRPKLIRLLSKVKKT
jgi:glycosyl-4,4'-diaponeurosporenoate acyltransferase